jgi:hypothetical protein
MSKQLTIDNITPEQKASYLAFAKAEWEKAPASEQYDFWHTTPDGLYDINVYEYDEASEEHPRSKYSVSLYDIDHPPSDRLPIYLGDI